MYIDASISDWESELRLLGERHGGANYGFHGTHCVVVPCGAESGWEKVCAGLVYRGGVVEVPEDR